MFAHVVCEEQEAEVEREERVDLALALHRFLGGEVAACDPGDNRRRRDTRFRLGLPSRQTRKVRMIFHDP